MMFASLDSISVEHASPAATAIAGNFCDTCGLTDGGSPAFEVTAQSVGSAQTTERAL